MRRQPSGSEQSLDYIRKTYGVPATKGKHVEYTSAAGAKRGVVTGGQGPHVMIQLEGEKHAKPYHPTWNIDWLVDTDAGGQP